MSIRAMIRRWVTDPWVADDPNPLPSQLDLIGGTYSIVHAAITRTVYHPGSDTTLVHPHVVDRIAREVTEALDGPTGEVGDVEAMRNLFPPCPCGEDHERAVAR